MSKKILIVEDEMIIAANISLKLTNLNYEITGIIPRGEQVMAHIEELPSDLVLLDINLKGKLDGVEVGQMIYEKFGTPVIYLTSNIDDATYNRAKVTKPYAFLSKPFNHRDLERTIELTFTRIAEENNKLMSKFSISTKQTEEEVFLEKVQQAILGNLEEPSLGPNELAKLLGTSRTQLHRMFKKVTDTSTSKYINKIRLEEAKRLLQSTNKTVSEVAYAVGYTTLSYFSSTFSKEYGQSPSEFRDKQ